MLHQSKMFGRHMIGDFTRLGQFSYRVRIIEQHLNHAKPHRVCQCSEALSGLSHHVELDQFAGTFLHREVIMSGTHDMSISISVVRNRPFAIDTTTDIEATDAADLALAI
jgi:hypothetical protein